MTFLPTLAAVVRLPTGDPFAPLEPPVVRVGQHHLHEHVVVRRQVETGHVEAEEREHPSGNSKANVRKGTGKVVFVLCGSPGAVSSPALLGDDHLRLVSVELEPQWSVTEVYLCAHPGTGG